MLINSYLMSAVTATLLATPTLSVPPSLVSRRLLVRNIFQSDARVRRVCCERSCLLPLPRCGRLPF